MTKSHLSLHHAVFVLFSLLLLPTPALYAGDTSLLMILDASGSMWGRVDGAPKITVARTAAAEAITALPPHIAAGLMLYGHRRKGDCQDIELVSPPGTPRAQLLTQLPSITPKGKTPLSASLEQAGELLAKNENESTILLISDGIETCGGEPCATVAALRRRGIKLVVHVVGFDVRGDAISQLQCIARAGGGGYFQADDTAGLRHALQSVQAAVVEHKPPPPPEPVTATPAPTEQASASKRVRIAGPGTVELVPAPWVSMPPRHWALVEAESGERRAEGSGMEARIKEGEYQVVWQQSEHGHAEITLTETVQVKSGQTTKLPVDTGLKLILPAGINTPSWWGLREANGQAPPAIRFRETLDPQLTPAGTYQLVWQQEEHQPPVELGPVTIESGRLNEIAVDSGLLLQPADWVTSTPYYYALLDAQGKQTARWTTSGPVLAPAGRYTLVLRPSEHGHQDIHWGEITLPAHGIQAVPIDSGIQFLHAAEAPPPYRIILTSLTGKQEIVARQNWDPLPAPPGHYRLDWQQSEHGSKRSTLVDDLTIEAATLVEIEL